jgi:hypothetical protein
MTPTRVSVVLSAVMLETSLLLTTGCSHQALQISVAKAQAPPLDGTSTTPIAGIPFYVKQGVCKRETVWLEPRYMLTLTVWVDDQPPVTHTLALSHSAYRSDQVQHLLKMLTGLSDPYKLADARNLACPADIGNLWDSVKADITDGLDLGTTISEAEKAGKVIRISNTAKLGASVDYTHPYFINARSPWIGTSQVDAKLASDGTLTEGSGQVDDETWSTILSTVSSLVGDFTGAGAAPATLATPPPTPSSENAAGFQPDNVMQQPPPPRLPSCDDLPLWPKPTQKVKYKFSLKVTVYAHDHKENSVAQHDLMVCTPYPDGVTQGNFSVSVVDNAAKPDPNTVQFSGTVKLPAPAKPDKKSDSSGQQ